MKRSSLPVLEEKVEGRIRMIRGVRIILDADLAELYGVSTKVLNQAVRRNEERFPADFAFRLTPRERREVVTNCDHLSGLRFSHVLPYAFTEHGVIMAANVLKSQRAVRAGLFVVRAFVRLRQVLAVHREMGLKLAELEGRVDTHDSVIREILEAIRSLMRHPEPVRERIGFHPRR